MKIAFIGQKGIPAKQGGIEKHVENLAVNLAKAGFDVVVYSRKRYTKSDRKSFQGVKIINLPSLPTKHFDAITHTFVASIHSLFQNYDLIHYHGVGPSLLAWIPRLFKPKAKVIVTFHCIDRQHQKWSVFAKMILALGEWTACRFPHETIVISQTLKKYCQYRFDRETTYIPNGVEISSAKNSNRILEKYNLSKNGYFLVASRLIQHKGVHTLIKAYQKIKTNKKLVIAGSGANTEKYVNQLKELADENKNIVFVGEQLGADLTALFKNAYLFVQPSEAEGMSIALLEAMAYGTPILVSDIEENLEAIKELGLTFKNKNVHDLARQLKFAENHSQLLKKQAGLAKKQVEKNHDWQDITKKTMALYRQAVDNREREIILEKA